MNTEECVNQATACLEQAESEPARKDHWIAEAMLWMQRSIEADGPRNRSGTGQG